MFSKKSAPSKLLAPHGELIFDGFWWDFAKQGINLASKSTPKYAKSNRREAIRFDSRTAKKTGGWRSFMTVTARFTLTIYLMILNLPIIGSSLALPFSALMIPITARTVIRMLAIGAMIQPSMGITRTTPDAIAARKSTSP